MTETIGTEITAQAHFDELQDGKNKELKNIIENLMLENMRLNQEVSRLKNRKNLLMVMNDNGPVCHQEITECLHREDMLIWFIELDDMIEFSKRTMTMKDIDK